jgi:hypothetical protein
VKYYCKICLPPSYKEQLAIVSAKSEQEAHEKFQNFVKLQMVINEVTIKDIE